MLRAVTCIGLVLICGHWICGQRADAALIGVTGAGDILIPNATPNTGATANFFGDPIAHGWDELQNVTLAANLTVDAVAPGLYDQATDLGNFVIPLGTIVSSHLLYYDPVGTASIVANYSFDSLILGVIVVSGGNAAGDRLLASDFLGHPLTVYPGGHFNNRGLEMNPDAFIIGAGGLDVTIRFTASSPGDQIRVITGASVPEPATMSLCGVGGLALMFLKRRRSAS